METHKITVSIGDLKLGPGLPILIQSMCSVSTLDTEACVEQCIRIFDAGGGLARLTAMNVKEARNLKNIRTELSLKGYHQPISADVHFNPSIALEAALHVEKVRINPGNFASDDIRTPFLEFLDVCRKHNTAIRIGVNHGSLSRRILEKYGDSPDGMVESALEYLRICKEENFEDAVVSLKSSNTRIMVYSNRLMWQRMHAESLVYPLHLGVTEAGEGEDGRIRSAAGIGTLLGEGLGDTVRVSLTEEPEFEIPVAGKLLEAIRSGTRSEAGYEKPYGNESPSIPATSFCRRKSEKYNDLGGGQVPLVLSALEETGDKMAVDNDVAEPDYIFVPDHRLLDNLPAGKKYILNAEAWVLDEYPANSFYPLFDFPGLVSAEKLSEILNFVLVRPEEVSRTAEFLQDSKLQVCVIYMHKQGETEAFLKLFDDPGLRQPVIIRAAYMDTDPEMFQLRAAAELSRYFIDGYADGIWLDNAFAERPIPPITAFKILQASRSRMTETEYIACPSCGRTLFNIQETLGRIKEATSGQKHLKIAVMGCIVNGPGEMADADYGYVGKGKGKVSLYRNRELIEKNIREEDAVKELVNLIKKNGDWND